MHIKRLIRLSSLAIILGAGIVVGCGPSEEEQAATSVALTAAAATSTPTVSPSHTPTPTSTHTPTPTPVPYDLSVLVAGEEEAPVIGALVVLAEIEDEVGTQITDDVGQAFWYELPGETINLSISAQGYFPQELTESISRGVNQLTVNLDRDLHGLLPSEACAPGEKLIYIEDFQDGEAAGWQEINYRASGWELIPHPETPEDLVTQHAGDQSSRSHLEDLTLDNAVWRIWMMLSGRGNYFLVWDWQEPTELEGGDFSTYQLDSSPPSHALYRVVWPNLHLTVSRRQQRIEEGVWHRFDVSNYEGRVEVWMDDVLWMAYQDPDPLPSGKIGLEVRQTNDEDFRIYFDDISVCNLTAPFAPMPTPESD